MNKILYIGGFELPDKNAAAHRVLGNAKALKAAGYEVILVGVNKTKSEFSIPQYVEDFKYFEYKYPNTLSEKITYLTSIEYLKPLLKKEKGISAIIAYNYPAFALNKLRFLGLKLFSDCTEWYLPEGKFLFKKIKWLDVVFRMKYVNKKVDAVIAISDFLETYYKPFTKTINIPPLLDVYNPKWENKKKVSLEKRNELSFIYSGSPGKGQKDNLEKIILLLWESSKISLIQYSLKIVGLTKEDFMTNCSIEKEESLALDFVEFIGRLSHLDSLNLIKECDYFVFFRDENIVNLAGFPTKFVEAVTLGIPIITNRNSNIESYFKKYPEIGILMDNLEPKELSIKIKQFESFKDISSCNSQSIFHYENFTNEFIRLLQS